MPEPRVVTRGRAVVVLICAALALVCGSTVVSGAGAAHLSTRAEGSGGPVVRGATWGSNRGVTSVSATLTVPAISCSAERRGKSAGQLLGVELSGTQRTGRLPHTVPDFTGILASCSGKKPHYSVEFETVDTLDGVVSYSNGIYRPIYSPAGPSLNVSPGDLLRLSISDPQRTESLKITDLSTPDQIPVHVAGPDLGKATGWAVGIFKLPGLTGPAPSMPALFTTVSAGGRSFAGLHAIASSSWTNGAGKRTATVGPLARTKSEFTAFTTSTPRPTLILSATAGEASGTVLYKVPGTDRWVLLDSITKLPGGSTIDALNGDVELSFALHQHQTQTALLWGGEFKFTQDSQGLTTFGVDGTCDSSCGTSTDAHAASKKKKHKSLGNLWSGSHGDYTTQGNYGAATVLGTTWLTSNQPGGTYFYVTKNHYDTHDVVRVTVDYPYPHSVTLGQGASVQAPVFTGGAEISFTGATETDGRYDVHVGGSYTLTLLSPTQPYYVDAADAPLGPLGGDTPFNADGSSGGIPRWTINFRITPNMDLPTWNVGVLVSGKVYEVPLRLVG